MNRHCTLKDRDRRSLHSLAINGFFFLEAISDIQLAQRCCQHTSGIQAMGELVLRHTAVRRLRFEGVCKAVFRMIKTLLSWQLRLQLEMSTVFYVMVATRICKPPSSSSTYI